MATVIPFDDVRLSPTTIKFEGGDEAPVSSFIVAYPRGRGPGLHVHPYPEVFFVLEGTATYSVADEELTVPGGHVVIVPAETPHGFKNHADETLRVLSVHPSPHVVQTDL